MSMITYIPRDVTSQHHVITKLVYFRYSPQSTVSLSSGYTAFNWTPEPTQTSRTSTTPQFRLPCTPGRKTDQHGRLNPAHQAQNVVSSAASAAGKRESGPRNQVPESRMWWRRPGLSWFDPGSYQAISPPRRGVRDVVGDEEEKQDIRYRRCWKC